MFIHIINDKMVLNRVVFITEVMILIKTSTDWQMELFAHH